MAGQIAQIFRDHFDTYAGCRKLPGHHHRAAWLIARCGRSELGGHLERCACAQTERIIWHSCRHRLCPRCAGTSRQKWLEREQARLLPVAHHHIVFTLPHQLLDVWRMNRRFMNDLLFTCASQCLRQLLDDPRYLGATPGLLIALHTWSRSGALHPHVHAMLTDGGLCDDKWVTPRRSHLLPARVLRALFRGKYLAAVRSALEAGSLRLPHDQSIERTRSMLNALARINWHVWLTERYAHGQGLLRYLARYLRGAPVRDAQIHYNTRAVTLAYRPHNQSATTLSLTPHAWIARLLEHTPPPGQHAIRRYGLYARRTHLSISDLDLPPERITTPRTFAQHPRPCVQCPHCLQALHYVQRIKPPRCNAPP